jgi:hypothetical protein
LREWDAGDYESRSYPPEQTPMRGRNFESTA